jgi:hypothetical protein
MTTDLSVSDPPALRRPRILSLMPTRQCTAACEHCGTFSSPSTKVRLSSEVIRQKIAEAAEQRFDVVVFTGGEATLAGDALFEYICLASRAGLCTRLVTNGHWARTEHRAAAYLKRLIDAGLREINFSTGDQHARFVPVESVLTGAILSVEAGLTTAVMVELIADRGVTKGSLLAHPLLCSVRGANAVNTIMFNESPWMSTDIGTTPRYPDGMAATSRNVHTFKGCDSVLTTVTIEADGRAYACCGLGMTQIPELGLGHAREMPLRGMIDKAEDDFLKRWIRTEGPERILHWAAQRDPKIDWEGRHAHKCQACMQLYKDPLVRAQIRSGYEEVMPEVTAMEWMLHYMPDPVGEAHISG